MSNLTNQLASIFPDWLVSNPYVMAGLTILIGWIVAEILSRVAAGALGFLNPKSKFAKNLGIAQGNVLKKSVRKIVFWVIMLFPFMNACEILGFSAAIEPIQGLLGKITSFIPNLIGFGIGLAATYFGFIIVKSILDGVFTAFDLDGKLNLGRFTGSSTSLSRVITTTAATFVGLMILPVAFRALNVPSVSQPIENIVEKVSSTFPNILIAIVLLGIGVLLAKVIQDLLVDVLKVGGIDQLPQKLGLYSSNSFKGKGLSEIIGYVVFASVCVIFLTQAINVLNLDFLSEIFANFTSGFFSILGAVIILLIGTVAARFAEKTLSSNAGVAKFAKYAIYILSGVMALDKAGIANQISSNGFLILLGAAGVALGVGGAIAIGLGGKEAASKVLNKLVK